MSRFSNSGKEEVPTPNFRNFDWSSLVTLTRIWSFMRPYRGWFALGMSALVLSTLTVLLIPQLAGDLINAATGAKTMIPGDLGTIARIFVVVLVVQAVLSFTRVYTFAQVSERTLSDIRKALYDRMLSLPLPFFEKRRVGELTSRIANDVTELQDLIASTMAEFLRQIATLVLGLTALFIKSPQLTGMMLLIVPVVSITGIAFGKYIRKLAKLRQDMLAESNVVVEETLQNIQTVKSFTNEILESRRYRGLQQHVVSIGLNAARYRGMMISFIILTFMGGIGIIMWYGSTMIQSGSMAAGDLITFIIYTAFIGGSIGGMVEVYGSILRSAGASDRLFELLEEPGEVDLSLSASPVPLKGAIALRDVSFSYPARPDIPVLRQFSLNLAPGEKVALAGPSGAGKSTVAQLILNFYEPQEGELLFDGRNASAYARRDLRRQIAVVPQEVLLFGGSIRENIAYGKPEASDAEIEQAARKANAWQFISTFPEQMDTVVGERGIKLSGGQRQRIAIARAILKDPVILILDEATSSLDAESERLVQDALEVLMAGRTTLVIAHRLSTIRNMDRIHVLQEGRIAESGTYEQLAAMPEGLFANLLRLQRDEGHAEEGRELALRPGVLR
jgi:ATP-binding cassette, subfamily B, bacterial